MFAAREGEGAGAQVEFGELDGGGVTLPARGFEEGADVGGEGHFAVRAGQGCGEKEGQGSDAEEWMQRLHCMANRRPMQALARYHEERFPMSVYTEPPLTIAALESIPDDGNRYELIEGELYVSTSPSFFHQIILGNLHFAFKEYLRKTPVGTAVQGVGVIFDDFNGVIRRPCLFQQ